MCICTAGTKNACVPPYEMVAADSCKVMKFYGGLLVCACLLCIACFVCSVVIAMKEIAIIKIRAREMHAKYGDLYAV